MEQIINWRPTAREALGFLAIVFLLIFGGYTAKWTGFAEDTTATKETTHYKDSTTTIDVAQDPRRAKTLWDWLQLLIIPAILAIGGFLFNRAQSKSAQRVEARRAQDAAVQAYLDQMGELLFNRESPLRPPNQNNDALLLARARTLTVLSMSDGDHKRSILQFLHEAMLIAKDQPVVPLHGADLSKAALRGVLLSGVDMRGAILTDADLRDAKLIEAKMSSSLVTTVISATTEVGSPLATDLSNATLNGADLTGADLSDAKLANADLRDTILTSADLSTADLSGADVRGVDLQEAEGLEQDQVEQAIGDQTTRLPDHIVPPELWGEEGIESYTDET